MYTLLKKSAHVPSVTKNMSFKLSIIIIHWNAPELLAEQLAALSNSPEIELIVVDNASKQSLKTLKQTFPRVTWIENVLNGGYAKASNQGAARANAPWLFFLNPDVIISSVEALLLLENGVKRGLDAFSPESNDSAYRKPIPSVASLLVEFTPIGKLIPLSLFPSRTLVGGMLYIKKEILLKLGGWDESFFLWFEDSDLTKRLLESDYQIGFIPSSVIHDGGATVHKLPVNKQHQIFFTSMRHYANKHFSVIGQYVIKLLANYRTRKIIQVK